MGFVTIRAALKAQLDTLVPATLNAVYNGEQDDEKTEIAGFPFAELRRVGNTNEFLTNKEDLPEYGFEIWVYQDLENQTIDQAEIALDTTIDAILQLFMTNRGTLEDVMNGGFQPVTSGSAVSSWKGKLVYATIISVKGRQILS